MPTPTLRIWMTLGITAGCLVFAALPAAEPPADPGLQLFRDQVRPLLTGKCLNCHDGQRKKGGLDLSRRGTALAGGDSGAALKPGRSADSVLLERVAQREMPPQNPLTPDQVDAFKRWIDAGAPYEGEPLQAAVQRAGKDWWSLRPVARPAPPTVRRSGWVRTPVDAFVLAGLEQQGLQPAPEADRRTLIRRVTFDLIGLPPTPDEVEAFVGSTEPNAYEKLVDRLLASPHYGERWARHWLDVVRFAESHGYEMNTLRPNAWPYRDYVIRAFNDDLPHPRFIQEQLAGDALPGADGLTQAATGFLVGGAHDMVGNQTEDGKLQQRMDDLDDMITATAATFLGLTLNCARCHDHKFDPLSQRDYYALQAVFAGVQHAERPLVPADVARRGREQEAVAAELARLDQQLDRLEPLAEVSAGPPRRPPVHPRRNVERFEAVTARFLRFTVTATNSAEPCLDELEVYTAGDVPRNIALAGAGTRATASSTLPNFAIHKLEHVNDGQYGNGRSWISNERGQGWVRLEFPEVVTIDRVVWGRDREEKYRDRLATAYRIEVAVEPGQWRVVASAADRLPYVASGAAASAPPGTPSAEASQLLRRRRELEAKAAQLNTQATVYAGTFTAPPVTHLLTRGDPMRRGDVVAPAAPEAVTPRLTLAPDAPESARRLALARWLGDAGNPLTRRVLVNRVWHYHFGQGLVSTPSDFGTNGARPSHPELLDWLADEFLRQGWRLKPLHRLLVLSATYRQSGQVNDRARSIDRQNKLLWRMTPRRLEAEGLRDAVLLVSGRLDRTMGGPGYYLWEKNTNYVVVFNPRTDLGPDTFRRMVYQFKPRSQQDPTFGVFDCPDAALAQPRRTSSTTVLQSLNLLNSRFILGQAESFAERLRREAGDVPEAQVRRAFALAFGRPPDEKELAAGAALVREHGPAALGRALFNANEFVYVD